MTGKQLRNSILQWAIQGKLVPQDPNDEPASVLLERIREEKARLVKEKKIKRDKNETIIYRGEDNSYYEKTLATGAVRRIDDEIPFEIPQGWEWVRLGSIFNHTSGKQQSSSNKCGGTPQRFITTSNLYWGRFVLDNVKVMNFTEEEMKTCSATKGDLLVCEGGAGYGRSAIWCYDYDICLQNHVHRLRPYVNGTCEYVYHFIYFLKETNQLAAVGTAMPGLSANRLKGLLLPLPPINEQQRIVAKLVNLEDYIHHYTKLDIELYNLNNDVYSNVNKSILQEAIQGRLVPQIESEGTAEELLSEIAEEKKRLVKDGKLKKSAIANESRIFRGDDNKYYEQIGARVIDIDEEIPFAIPDSWRWIRLGYVVDFSSNGSVKSENIHQDSWILDLEDIEKDSGNLLRRKKMSESNAKSDKHSFFAGNILYSKLRPYLNKVLIADMDGFCTSEILAFDFGKINSEYALAYLRSPFFVEYAMSDAYGVKMPRLGSKQGNNALMPIPPMAEQQRIVSRIKQLKSHLV